MKIDKKTIAIIVLSVALLIVGYVAFAPTPPPYDVSLIHKQIDELNAKNSALEGNILALGKEVEKKKAKIDSLQSLKPKILIKYVQIYKQIDNSSANSVANDFQSIFATDSIK